MPIPLKLLIVLSLLCAPVISSSFVSTPAVVASGNQLNSGYSALKLFLEDEENLTTIRHIKAVINFGGISEPSKKLIDDITESATVALASLEVLASAKPAIVFVEFSDDLVGKKTLDSLRMTTAKEFLFENENFEKNLLISQAQVLRVISHLASALAEKELNKKRKIWLEQLARQYEHHYMLIYKRIALA